MLFFPRVRPSVSWSVGRCVLDTGAVESRSAIVLLWISLVSGSVANFGVVERMSYCFAWRVTGLVVLLADLWLSAV